MKTILSLALLSVTITTLYSDDSTVFKLTEQNFKEKVLKSDQFWLVEFYAPWCGHCKKAVPEYEQAAEILQGIVNLGAVDMTTDREAGAKYGISGYPTIKLFAGDKNKPIDFSSGERTFDKFVDFCVDHMKNQIRERERKIKAAQAEEL